MMINPTSPCVDCGKPIDNGHWYYGKGRGGVGKDGYHHSTCGDPLGIEAAVAAERERCAKIAETFCDDILVFVERPGGPPGNFYRKATKSDIADAIRSGVDHG